MKNIAFAVFLILSLAFTGCFDNDEPQTVHIVDSRRPADTTMRINVSEEAFEALRSRVDGLVELVNEHSAIAKAFEAELDHYAMVINEQQTQLATQDALLADQQAVMNELLESPMTPLYAYAADGRRMGKVIGYDSIYSFILEVKGVRTVYSGGSGASVGQRMSPMGRAEIAFHSLDCTGPAYTKSDLNNVAISIAQKEPQDIHVFIFDQGAVPTEELQALDDNWSFIGKEGECSDVHPIYELPGNPFVNWGIEKVAVGRRGDAADFVFPAPVTIGR